MPSHEDYMSYCIELAKRAEKATKTNPMVGSVLVYNDQIIGQGYHEKYGEAHAERNAINDVADSFKNHIPLSTLYVTLEPCFHQGKTPPCVNYILKNNIKKVVIGCTDPNPLVAGQSISLLRNENVEVLEGVLEKECQFLIRKFRANLEERPYIILKWAQSKDGYLGKKGKQVWISNQYSKILVHQWRSQVDGIMIGTQTAIQDNPALTTREWKGQNPIRVVPDFNHRIPLESQLFVDGHPTIILNKDKNEIVNEVEYLAINEKSIALYWKALFQKGINSLLVEGGQKILEEIVSTRLWDEARIIKSEKSLNSGLRAPTIIGSLHHKQRLSDDLIVTILNDGS